MAGNLPTAPDMSSAGHKRQTRAWVGLGSNMGNGRRQIGRALDLMRESSSIQVMRTSRMYVTKPWGMSGQADFTNSAAELMVRVEANELFLQFKGIEQKMGRVPSGSRWGPRVIDLDLLLFGGLILFRPGLTVPHPRMHKRAFVLVPVYDLEPDLIIPARGTVRSCLARLGGPVIDDPLADDPLPEGLGVELLPEENDT